jgi:all-trans-retinol dehydrogenase (NAD+)
MKNLSGKSVLITGGASGIGKLMALDFAARGAVVTVWDLSAPALKTLETEAATAGLPLSGVVCDVSDKEAIYRCARDLENKRGVPDILMNNAGIVSGKTLLETPDEKIIKTMEVNVLPLFWTAKAFLPSMLERNSGHIVTIASAAGLIGVRGLGDYCASKFAAVGFDESLRMELRRQKSKVRTTVVCPFFLDTGMFRGVKTRFPLLLPIMQSEAAARRIVKAVLGKRKRYIMPPFVNLVLLLRVFPLGFLDCMADFFGISHAMDEFTGREPEKTM